MPVGSGSGFAVIAVLLVMTVVIGVVLGRYAWPRRSGRQDTSATPLSPPPRAADLVPGVAAAGDSAATRADAGTASGRTQTDAARARAAELEAKLVESEATLKQAWRQLTRAEVELVRMRRQVREVEDRKDAEMGRLESGAITALESTTAAHQEQTAKLEEKLRAAEAAIEECVRELDFERKRSARLQAALAERDQHTAARMSEDT